jgi:hypothetical protein
LEEFVVTKVKETRERLYYKFVGGAITKDAAQLCPDLAKRLWMELDIVMFILSPFDDNELHQATNSEFNKWVVDEESDSVVRKAVR